MRSLQFYAPPPLARFSTRVALSLMPWVLACANTPASSTEPVLETGAAAAPPFDSAAPQQPGPGGSGGMLAPAATAPPDETAPAALPLEPGAAGAAGSSSAGTEDAGIGSESAGGPATTRGSGGPVGPAELVSRGGLSYRIDGPAAGVPHGLLILLHGSTASNYTTFVSLMQDVANAYDLIPVSVLAPNGQGWNEGNQIQAAELLHRLVQEDLYAMYDIDLARVIFSGQSSGGGFLSSNFVPAHAKDYTGGAFFQCGAARPNIAFTPSPETRQNFRLHFEITTGDPIWPESYAQSVAAYTSVGMQFTADDTKPGGHCQFDQQQVILDHIDAVLGN